MARPRSPQDLTVRFDPELRKGIDQLKASPEATVQLFVSVNGEPTEAELSFVDEIGTPVLSLYALSVPQERNTTYLALCATTLGEIHVALEQLHSDNTDRAPEGGIPDDHIVEVMDYVNRVGGNFPNEWQVISV